MEVGVTSLSEKKRRRDEEMSWEAAGAIGEILGATGVIVTLLYLARQTRINTRAIEASSAREITIAESELHRDLSRDPSLKKTFQKSYKVSPC